MRSLPLHKAGVGSAVNDTTRELGGALGVAVMGSLVSSAYASRLASEADRRTAWRSPRDQLAVGAGVAGHRAGQRRPAVSAAAARPWPSRPGRRSPARWRSAPSWPRCRPDRGAFAAWRWVPGRNSLAWTTPPCRRPPPRRQPELGVNIGVCGDLRGVDLRGVDIRSLDGAGDGGEPAPGTWARTGGARTGPAGCADCGMRLVVWNLCGATDRKWPHLRGLGPSLAVLPEVAREPRALRSGGLVPAEADWHWVGATPSRGLAVATFGLSSVPLLARRPRAAGRSGCGRADCTRWRSGRARRRAARRLRDRGARGRRRPCAVAGCAGAPAAGRRLQHHGHRQHRRRGPSPGRRAG